MRNWTPSRMASATLVLASVVCMYAQQSATPAVARNASALAADTASFNPRDLDGTWRGVPGTPQFRNFASFDNKIPEPPLTEWAKQHLLMKSISHDALAGKRIPGSDRPGHICPNNQDPCYSEDQNGVIANDPNGEYPAKDCEPLTAPALYDYPSLGSIEFLTTRDGDRIFQLFEYHREWRTFWMNQQHPKDLDPAYEGNSVAHWEGNTLVVDTIGFNGKTMISQNIGHWKSRQFRLEERFTRVDRDHLQIDMTYYDSLAWNDKAWSGFRKLYRRVPKEDFQEFICSPREYMRYNNAVTDNVSGQESKN